MMLKREPVFAAYWIGVAVGAIVGAGVTLAVVWP